MAVLKPISALTLDRTVLLDWGKIWTGTVSSSGGIKKPNCFDKKQGMDFGKTIDPIVAKCIAGMLGEIPVVSPASRNKLLPPYDDCVELGDTRLVGGIRTQNYDIMYRPDGVRIAYDSKTLNDQSSMQKNWHNMINDLASEATTVHTRFPYALALFLVMIPADIFIGRQTGEIIRTLERLNGRSNIREEEYKAESIALVIWNPHTGEVDPRIPNVDSSLRLEQYSRRIEKMYFDRYAGLPPHTN